jgi:antitoxin (DNA-binding transcriptional repressor) of toxin-antitoxin stability system
LYNVRYPDAVTAAHAFELPPHSAAPAEAVDAAADGQVVYLTRDGERIAAIVPAEVAAAGAAAIEALEDAEDIRAARASLADPAPSIPMSEIMAMYAADLAAYPDTEES